MLYGFNKRPTHIPGVGLTSHRHMQDICKSPLAARAAPRALHARSSCVHARH